MMAGDMAILDSIKEIKPVSGEAMRRAMARQDSLAKPPGSLGGLEDIAVRLAGIYGAGCVERGSDAEKKGCVIVFCADNGVAETGVASAPQSVTRAQTINFTRRLTGVGTLAESYGSELLIVDVGVKEPIPEELYDDVPLRDTHRIIDRRIGPGTRDISRGPAMSREEVLKAMKTGLEMAEACAEEGFGILGVGEMGIGNTTTSAAVLSALTGKDSGVTCGRGGGLNDEGFKKKKAIIDRCSAKYRDMGGLLSRYPLSEKEERHEREARLEAVIEVLSECGGFDLCAMTGAYLGAARERIPVVVDGYISVVAALAAAVICPESAGYMFASHKSAEPGYALAVERLGLKPFLALDMRLGEGSGCPIAFCVIKGAWDVMRNMATFDEAEINDDYLEEVRRGGCF